MIANVLALGLTTEELEALKAGLMSRSGPVLFKWLDRLVTEKTKNVLEGTASTFDSRTGARDCARQVQAFFHQLIGID